MLAIASEVLVDVQAHNSALLIGIAVLWIVCIYLMRHECYCGKCEHCRIEQRAKAEARMRAVHDQWHYGRKTAGCPFCQEDK